MNETHWRKNLFLIWLSQFISMAAFSSSYTFIPFYIKYIGVTDPAEALWYVGMFNAAGNLSFAVFSPIWGKIADVCGRKPMLLRANFGAALLLPLMGLIHSPDLLVVHRLAIGALSGTVVAAQTLVLGCTPSNRRSFALGVIASALFSGMMVGQFFGGFFVDAFGYNATFLSCGAMLAVSGLLVLIGVNERFTPVETLRGAWKKFSFHMPRFGPVWYMMLLFFCMALVRDFDGPFVPNLVDVVMNHDPAALRWSGIMGSICCVAGVLSGVLLGWLAGKFSIYKLILLAVFISGCWRLPQGMATGLWMLIGTRFLMVFAAGGVEPLLQSWLAGVTPEKDHGTFFGWAACCKAIGWTLGGAFGGLLGKLVSGDVRMIFYIAGGLFFLLLPLIRFVHGRIPPPDRRSVRRGGAHG